MYLLQIGSFELDHLPLSQFERYGDTPFGRGCMVAKQLVETGVRFVQVNRGGFDTHRDNFEAMRNHGEVMDPALASLIQDLDESGQLKKTLVVMLSEFGRTPKINKDGGRDHYPGVFSCFMAGGGIQGGQLVAQLVLMVGIDSPGIVATAVEKFLQPFVLDALDQLPLFLLNAEIV